MRPEILQMWNELDLMINKTMPMIKQHYKEAGTPRSTSLNNFALPEEIIEALGPINNQSHSVEECIKNFETVMKYSVNTMHPYFYDKL